MKPNINQEYVPITDEKRKKHSVIVKSMKFEGRKRWFEHWFFVCLLSVLACIGAYVCVLYLGKLIQFLMN